jgi:thiosulfate/3-mercaptopyruvate sulfurtransferase
MSERNDPLVSTEWLAAHLADPHVKVVDATFFLPGQGDASAAYRAAHIPGAIRFDVDEVAEAGTALPHMLPSPEAFGAAVGAMGIGDDDLVVAYGVAAPRVWWMFRAMGHDQVAVLDGGCTKWRAEGRPLDVGAPDAPAPARFTARFRPELVRGFDEMRAALAAGHSVLDARPAERFRGEAPEPRPGLRSGHMPGARSLPSASLFAADATFHPPETLEALVRAAGHDPAHPAIATCGSGVTACMVALALARLGRWDVPVYDGSWSEWGGRDDAQVATG